MNKKEELVVNCCNHEILESVGGNYYPELPEHLKIRAYANINNDYLEDWSGSPVKMTTVHSLHLPESKEGVKYLVSSLVLGYIETLNLNRPDIGSPGQVKRKNGNVSGCETFRTFRYNPDKPQLKSKVINIKISDEKLKDIKEFLNESNNNKHQNSQS